MLVTDTKMWKAIESATDRLYKARTYLTGEKYLNTHYFAEGMHLAAFRMRPWMDFRERNNRLSQLVDFLEPDEFEALYNGLDVESDVRIEENRA